MSAPPGLEQQILNPPAPLADDLVQQYSSTSSSSVANNNVTAASVVAGTATAANNNAGPVQYAAAAASATSHLRQALDIPQLNSSSLSAEQSQYFNSLSSQNSTQQPPAAGLVSSYQPSAAVQYSSSPYAANNNYAEQVVAGQQQVQSAANRNSKRARVPPPSKIPSSAVEMPDTLSNIGYLDVQFGALDFGTDESFDTISDKFQSTGIVDSSQTATDDYQSKAQSTNAGLQPAQLSADALSGQTDNLAPAGYSQRGANAQTASSANTLSNASAG